MAAEMPWALGVAGSGAALSTVVTTVEGVCPCLCFTGKGVEALQHAPQDPRA